MLSASLQLNSSNPYQNTAIAFEYYRLEDGTYVPLTTLQQLRENRDRLDLARVRVANNVLPKESEDDNNNNNNPSNIGESGSNQVLIINTNRIEFFLNGIDQNISIYQHFGNCRKIRFMF